MRLGDQFGGIGGRAIKRQHHGAMRRRKERIGGDGIGGESEMREVQEMEEKSEE